ncbi:MAG: hypothetical protein PHP85_07495 [Gallionella sp.]|nr:hypothetical protein [Gallionella sp.]
MKTQPAKLILALLFSLGSVVSASAFAGDDNKDSKESKDAKDSNRSVSTQRCTGELISACGLKLVKTTCTGSSVDSSTKSEERDDETHHSKDKDAKDNKNDRERAEDSRKDHADRSSGPKVSICHRMGGAEVSITVANDGYLSGHSKHALDTIGRCADFDTAKNEDDSKAEKDKDHKISASDTGYSIGMTTTQIACLKAAGLNSSAFSISVQSPGQAPSRGGARTLH